MSYKDKQRELVRSIEVGFKRGDAPSTIVSSVTNYADDRQIGLTSVSFLSRELQYKISSEIIAPLRAADPNQYYYPPESLHLTVQNLKTISDPPLFDRQYIEKARKVFAQTVPNHEPLSLDIQGIFELPTSLALCAFSSETYEELVLNLRKGLEVAGIPDDKKYAPGVVLGNITFCRFTQKPNISFEHKVEELKEVKMGSFELENIYLIQSNAVCSVPRTEVLDRFILAKF